MEVLIWIGLSQSLFAALIIVTKRRQSVSDKILSAWLFLLAISFLLQGINYKVFGYPLLSNSFLLFNPAIYFYIKSLVRKDFKLKWSQLWHLSPYIIFETAVYTLKIPLSFDAILNQSDSYVFSILFIAVLFLSWLYYMISSSLLVHEYRMNLKNEFSNIDDRNSLVWIIFILWFYVSLCATLIFLGVYSFFNGTEMIISYKINYISLLALVFILGFYGLRQRELFQKEEAIEPEKYKNSLLAKLRKKEIKTELIQYFENEKPYLDSDLSMDKLSNHLNIPKHHITEVLNTEIQKNFFLFVNTYRIEAAKMELSNKNHPHTIEAIGYDCGFSSKSSFYTTFKRMTGFTPLQFKKSMNS